LVGLLGWGISLTQGLRFSEEIKASEDEPCRC